jgi:hypothetical protein
MRYSLSGNPLTGNYTSSAKRCNSPLWTTLPGWSFFRFFVEAPRFDGHRPEPEGLELSKKTVDQNLALQRDALIEAECEKIFTEQMSGAVLAWYFEQIIW